MALLLLFLLFVSGSFAMAFRPVTRVVRVVSEVVVEPPMELPAVVPVDQPLSSPMADTLVGIEFSDALSIGLVDQLEIREAA